MNKNSISIGNKQNIFYRYYIELSDWFKKNKERLNLEGFTDNKIFAALALYEKLGIDTTREYISNRKSLFEDKKTKEAFDEEIFRLYKSVITQGKIEAISERFMMTKKESVNQCLRADEAFTKRPDLQKILADANYSFFTGRTMATAIDLLSLDLNSFYTEGMPHLTASNGAIGYLVKDYVIEKSTQGETVFTLTDMGSGSGATLAGIVLGLSEADKELERKVNININSIEGCYAFYDALRKEMLPAILSRAEAFRNIKLSIDITYGDIPVKISDVKVKGSQIYTANYVFHRLSDKAKEEVFCKIGKNSYGNDAAFFLADIYRNTSEMPNRRYFNFALNGPLNSGNDVDLMQEFMGKNGFSRIITDDNMSKFRALPKPIINACNQAKYKEQGFLIVGYRK